MSGPNYVKQPAIQRLPNLFEEINSGHLLIPRFQRPFVWNDEQRLNLLDSVYKGMPIGSILVWRTYQHKLECYDRLGPLTVATRGPSDNEVKQYLLDGHQRLTTLYVAFHARHDADSDSDNDNDADDRQWPVCFDLATEKFALYPKNGKLPPTWIPLAILFDSYELFAFQKQLFERSDGRALGQRAERLAAIFKDYSIAVVPIVTENLDVVTESFQRINSAGTAMSEMHMVNALTWSEQFDLHKAFDTTLERFAEFGWQDLDQKSVLNACKIEFNLDIYATNVSELTKRMRESTAMVEAVTHKLERAIGFLHDHCLVHGPNALPYTLQLLALAHVLPEEPDEELLERLTRWFWITTYTEYVGSGTNASKLSDALAHLREVVAGTADPMPPDALPTVKPIRTFFYLNGRARALALQLVRLGPLSPDGKQYDGGQQLGAFGNKAVLQLLTRRYTDIRNLGKQPANRVLIVRDDLRALRTQLAEGSTREDVLASHGISKAAAEAFAAGDYAGFLRERWQTLLSLEEQHVTSFGLSYVRE